MQVLEKCLNFFNCKCSGLYQKCFLMLFGCLRLRINHNSEKLKVIYIKCFCLMQELIVNLRQVNRECGEANSSGLKVLLEWTGNLHFCTICEITFLEGGPWKSNVVLEKSFKMVVIFCMNPATVLHSCTPMQTVMPCCQSECAHSIIVTINPLQSPPLKYAPVFSLSGSNR